VAIEPAQARLDPGQQLAVRLTYTPPPDGGGSLGLWRTLRLEGALRGGEPAPLGGEVALAVKLRYFCPAKG
jgi:hypothetical protein